MEVTWQLKEAARVKSSMSSCSALLWLLAVRCVSTLKEPEVWGEEL